MAWTNPYTLEPHFPFSAQIISAAGQCRKALHEWTERRKIYRQTLFELSVCTDRQLKDLGIVRCDIGRIAHEAMQKAKEV